LARRLIAFSVLDLLHPRVASWFRRTFAGPTQAQAEATPFILAGKSVLVSSPTGSGKTLSGFLGVLDGLARLHDSGNLGAGGVQCLYVSPLRALTYDLTKNLRGPLDQLGFEFVRVSLRNGDTSARDRDAQRRHPPHILATTPERLALLVTQPAWRVKPLPRAIPRSPS
jgi:ATP-dependent Lhr-like helicase